MTAQGSPATNDSNAAMRRGSGDVVTRVISRVTMVTVGALMIRIGF